MIGTTITPERAELVISGKSLGSAGVIERDGILSIALFASTSLRFPCAGRLDGRAITIHSGSRDTVGSRTVWSLAASYDEEAA